MFLNRGGRSRGQSDFVILSTLSPVQKNRPILFFLTGSIHPINFPEVQAHTRQWTEKPFERANHKLWQNETKNSPKRHIRNTEFLFILE